MVCRSAGGEYGGLNLRGVGWIPRNDLLGRIVASDAHVGTRTNSDLALHVDMSAEHVGHFGTPDNRSIQSCAPKESIEETPFLWNQSPRM